MTALVAEVYRDVWISATATDALLELRYYLTTSEANGNTLREAGVFTEALAGIMYARAPFAEEIAKTSDIAVHFTWSLNWAVG